MKDKKILVLGGQGFIGSHLVKKLLSEKYDVTVFSGDIRNYENVEREIKGKDIIINCATVISDTNNFNPYPDLEVNCLGQLNVLEVRKKINPSSKYIYLGTKAQFGKVPEKDLPVREEYPQSPLSLYATHKTAAENYCHVYFNAYQLPSLILRLAPVYGPSITNKKTHGPIGDYIKTALLGETIKVRGFGKDLKDFIYVDDVVSAIISAMESPIMYDTYNVGSGSAIPFFEVARIIVEECKAGNYEPAPFPDHLLPFEMGSFYFDISKIKKELGWTPQIDLRDGIKKMISHIKHYG